MSACRLAFAGRVVIFKPPFRLGEPSRAGNPNMMRHWKLNLLQGWLALATGVMGGDQAQWGRKHSRNMVSSEPGLPGTFDPATGRNVKWSVEIGTSSYSTPIVAGGRVFIGTNNGLPRDPKHRGDRGVLMCFDEKDGRFLWQLVVPKLPRDPYLDCPRVGITSTAAVEGDRVYIVSNRGEVICLDTAGMENGNQGPFFAEDRHMTPPAQTLLAPGETDGDIIWLYDMPAEVGAYTHDSSNVSVLLDEQFLYVATPNGVNYTHRHRPSPQAPGLIVLDKQTGRRVAQDETGIGARVFHSTFSSPSLGLVNDRQAVFYGGADGVCYAFAALGGIASQMKDVRLKTIWQFDCDPAAPKENISEYQGNRTVSPSTIIGMPVFHQGRLYLTAGGDPWHGKRQAWLKCLDANQGTEIWSYPLRRHCIATPSVHNGLVFVGDFGKMIHCVDAETGRPHWTHETEGEIWGSTLVADGKAYVGTTRGDFWILSAQKEKQVLGRVEFDEEINGTPTAANGALFIATMSRLYALKTTGP